MEGEDIMKTITMNDIDFTKAIEVVPSRNPDTDIRFIIPVPNYLQNHAGDELVKKYWFITQYQKNEQTIEMRLKFKNFSDNCMQGVRINGEGAIVFMGKDLSTYRHIMEDLQENYDDIANITLEDVSKILTKTRVIYGITDRYNKKQGEILDTMDNINELHSDIPCFGGFYYKKNVSTAVYVRGKGQFLDGPTLTPQQFEDGAFIVFSNTSRKDLIERFNGSKNEISGKVVQRDVFLKTRATLHSDTINIELIPFI